MPEIHSAAPAPGWTAEELWNVVKDGRACVGARDVVSVEELPSTASGHRSTRWTVLLNGSEVTWTQREWAEAGSRLVFEQTSGDLEELTGEWTVAPAADGAQVMLRIAFELGIDGLAPLLEPIWAQSFQAHTDALLRTVTAARPTTSGNALT